MAEILLVRSLQRKVTVITSAAVALALGLGIHGAQQAEHIEQHQHLDMHLAEVAQTVIEFSREEARRALENQQARLTPHVYQPAGANSDLSFQVWLREGAVLLKTNMPTTAAPLMPLHELGYASGTVDGMPGRMFALPDENQTFIVQVAEQLEDRDNDTPTLLHYYFLPIALPLLFAMVATWMLLRRSSDALDSLVHRLRHLDLGTMAMVSIDKPTAEIMPVIREFNSVFQRASQALQTEQRFTAMAAHELRTPLAGIRAQAQLALRAQGQEQRTALQAVVGGVSRASHVFDQLLDLTRVDNADQQASTRFQAVSIDAVYQMVICEQTSALQARHMDLQVNWQAPTVFGADFAIFLLLRNLLSNAILYAGEGGRIEASSLSVDGHWVLCVDDSGPGIPADARDKAFERFNRLAQHGTEGVGLGLSIVQMVVSMHHGSIALQDSPLGGLRVWVALPGIPGVGVTA